jgi:carboxylate-amine ligase
MGGGRRPRARSPRALSEHNFGRSLTIGVEEELMILDPRTGSQQPASGTLIPAVETDRGRVKHELFQSVIELNTDVCATTEEAADALRELRRATIEAATGLDYVIAAAGSHPFDIASEQPIADEPHYTRFVEYAGPSARRQGVSGLHVHIGMPDRDSCLHVLETVLPWLPLVLALSANSPWFEGKRTGLMSTRAEILGLLPRHSAPPAFSTWDEWERLIATFVRSGLVDSYKALHWDIRPHPELGTLEVRMPDQPTAVETSARFVELIHALCKWALQQDPGPAHSRALYDQNRWAAARFGPRAELVHPDADRVTSVAVLYAELVERIERDPGLDAARCEGDGQLVHDRPEDVVAELVERTKVRA